jgi:deoxycytidylate deaminase
MVHKFQPRFVARGNTLNSPAVPNRREAFVGLIAPIGVNIDGVVGALADALRNISYDTNSIRLTDLIEEQGNKYDTVYNSQFERYQKFIKAGDDLCEDSERDDLFALYGVGRLNAQYQDRKNDLPGNVVHVFRQLKRVEEIDTLRSVFGTNILMLACHATRTSRIAYLGSKILSSSRGLSRSELDAKALKIISIDENEKDNPHGQRVIECFSHADFVLDCTTHAALTASAARFVETFFGNPFVSPTVDEYCSYVAKSASLRSVDLSRQVGAAIFGANCEIVSLGCNEVPKAGGGTYWINQENDFRDFRLGVDSNHKVRTDMLRDLLSRLQDEGWLSDDYATSKPDDLVALATARTAEGEGPLAGAMVNDVIEYGRMVHAEMNAITDPARFRRSTEGATLYCTTMPCHLCSKPVIAAGIKRVVYIEPYQKSLVEELFGDSVTLEGTQGDHRVKFEQLRGVTPLGFKMVFSKGKRKNADGTVRSWDRASTSPVFVSDIAYYAQLEPMLVDSLKAAIERVSKKPPKFELIPS